jgi:hypothetical protein
MRDVIRNPWSPNALEPALKPVANVRTKSAERPLKVPSAFETELIDALAKTFVGGPNEPVK